MQSSVRRSSAFLCAVIMRARRPATRGFSARGYSFDAHGTDGRHGLGFAGLPRGLQAHPLGNNIFFARKAKRARAKGCSGTRTALLTTRPPDKHIRTPHARERRRLFYMENIKYAYSRPFPLKKHRSAHRLYNCKHTRSRSGDAALAYDPPAHRIASHGWLRPFRPRGFAALSDFAAAEKRAKTGLKNKSKCDIIAA